MTSSDMGFFVVALAIIFTILKVSHVIDWSWWWVLAPLWLWFGLSLLLVAVTVVIVAVIAGLRD